MSINRRSLITGLISLVAAPAIVRAANIMPVRSFAPPVGSLRMPYPVPLKIGDILRIGHDQLYIVTAVSLTAYGRPHIVTRASARPMITSNGSHVGLPSIDFEF
jgi:hypothetical protein